MAVTALARASSARTAAGSSGDVGVVAVPDEAPELDEHAAQHNASETTRTADQRPARIPP
jgi:hypothetical protein